MSTINFSLSPIKNQYDDVQAVVRISTQYGNGISLAERKLSSESMSHFQERVTAAARERAMEFQRNYPAQRIDVKLPL